MKVDPLYCSDIFCHVSNLNQNALCVKSVAPGYEPSPAYGSPIPISFRVYSLLSALISTVVLMSLHHGISIRSLRLCCGELQKVKKQNSFFCHNYIDGYAATPYDSPASSTIWYPCI